MLVFYCAAHGALVDSSWLSLASTCLANSRGSFRANLVPLILSQGRSLALPGLVATVAAGPRPPFGLLLRPCSALARVCQWTVIIPGVPKWCPSCAGAQPACRFPLYGLFLCLLGALCLAAATGGAKLSTLALLPKLLCTVTLHHAARRRLARASVPLPKLSLLLTRSPVCLPS